MKRKYSLAEERVVLKPGDIVKVAREMMEMTQAMLAKKTGISISHISEIEANHVEIGRKRALLFARALKVPAPYIMFPTPQFYTLFKKEVTL